MINNNKKATYDRNIFIKNVERIMNDKNIKQAHLVDYGVAPQPRISACLNKNKKDNFTLEQIVLLSSFLNISIDELIGIKRKDEKENATLKEVISLFFALDIIAPFKLGEVVYEISGVDFQDGQVVDIEEKTPAIYFDPDIITNSHFIEFLQSFKDVKNFCKDRDKDNKMYALWKETTLTDSELRLKKWNYRTEKEEAQRLLEILLDECDEYNRSQGGEYSMYALHSVWTDEQIELIEKNVYITPNIEYSLRLARESGFMNIPDAVDEELPFS